MIRTGLHYLARDELYRTEKPYSADFEVDKIHGAKKSNLVISVHEIDIIPVINPTDFDIDVHGFCIINEETTLTMNDALEKPDEVEPVYQAELEAILHKYFPEYNRFESLDFVVRKRDPRYPSNERAVLKHEQPAAIAHTDYTLEGAIEQLKGSFPGQEKEFIGKEFDMLNVWKPLVGPNNDWPLGLCDFTTVAAEDITSTDVLHTDRVTENQILYPSKRHQWYYIKDQQPQEMIVFRNTDTTRKRPVGFHAAFANPQNVGPPRSSVEVRFVAFR